MSTLTNVNKVISEMLLDGYVFSKTDYHKLRTRLMDNHESLKTRELAETVGVVAIYSYVLARKNSVLLGRDLSSIFERVHGWGRSQVGDYGRPFTVDMMVSASLRKLRRIITAVRYERKENCSVPLAWEYTKLIKKIGEVKQ